MLSRAGRPDAERVDRRLLAVVAAASVLSAAPLHRTGAQASAPELPDPLEAGWQGARVCESLHEAPDLRVLRCTFPPGGGHERHFHAPHFGYILEGGRMRITDAGGTREVDLETGARWVSDGVDWHEVLNVGGTASRYLIIEPR